MRLCMFLVILFAGLLPCVVWAKISWTANDLQGFPWEAASFFGALITAVTGLKVWNSKIDNDTPALPEDAVTQDQLKSALDKTAKDTEASTKKSIVEGIQKGGSYRQSLQS